MKSNTGSTLTGKTASTVHSTNTAGFGSIGFSASPKEKDAALAKPDSPSGLFAIKEELCVEEAAIDELEDNRKKI